MTVEVHSIQVIERATEDELVAAAAAVLLILRDEDGLERQPEFSAWIRRARLEAVGALPSARATIRGWSGT